MRNTDHFLDFKIQGANFNLFIFDEINFVDNQKNHYLMLVCQSRW